MSPKTILVIEDNALNDKIVKDLHLKKILPVFIASLTGNRLFDS